MKDKIKYILGYLFFIAIVSYGVINTDFSKISKISIGWLLVSIAVSIVMYLAQYLQIKIFLRYHNVTNQWIKTAIFTAKKGALNTILPARGGTLVLLASFIKNNNLKYKDFILFMLVSGLTSITLSFVGFFFIFMDKIYGLIIVGITILVIVNAKKIKIPYGEILFKIYLISLTFFGCNLLLVFCILRGLNYGVNFLGASYFTIALNILSQFSFTPGNMGVREATMGLISPYLSIPISVGITSGAVLLFIRLCSCSFIVLFLELLPKKSS